MFNTYGIPISPGIKNGQVLIKQDPSKNLCYIPVSPQDIKKELDKYHKALAELQEEFEHLKASTQSNLISKQMIEFYHTILYDPFFIDQIPNMIKELNVSAQHAVIEKLNAIESEFSNLTNEYFKNRFSDFKSIGNQLLDKLNGSCNFNHIKKPVILITKDLSAAELLHMNTENILGVILENGGATSHTAILLNSMEIPAIFGVEHILSNATNNDPIILDGYKGKVIINPSKEVSYFYSTMKQKYDDYNQNIAKVIQEESTTEDQESFCIMANIGNIEDVDIANKNGAEGIGLFRTEIFNIASNKFLDEEATIKYYKDLTQRMPNKPFTIRTIDLGGDKFLPFQDSAYGNENNPNLGYRSTRYFIQQPKILKDQLSVLIRTSEFHPHIKIMFPFITTVDDIIRLKEIFFECWNQHHSHDCPIAIGMMAEVPATLICIDQFLPHVDFVSIGSNDLIQYVLAADRSNTSVSQYYQMSNPAVLKLIAYTIERCNRNNTPISICGEIAKDPLYTRLLLGMGLREFSMHPSAIPMIKYILKNSNTNECKQLWHTVSSMTNHGDIDIFLQNELNKFLRSNNAFLDIEHQEL